MVWFLCFEIEIAVMEQNCILSYYSSLWFEIVCKSNQWISEYIITNIAITSQKSFYKSNTDALASSVKHIKWHFLTER